MVESAAIFFRPDAAARAAAAVIEETSGVSFPAELPRNCFVFSHHAKDIFTHDLSNVGRILIRAIFQHRHLSQPPADSISNLQYISSKPGLYLLGLAALRVHEARRARPVSMAASTSRAATRIASAIGG